MSQLWPQYCCITNNHRHLSGKQQVPISHLCISGLVGSSVGCWGLGSALGLPQMPPKLLKPSSTHSKRLVSRVVIIAHELKQFTRSSLVGEVPFPTMKSHECTSIGVLRLETSNSVFHNWGRRQWTQWDWWWKNLPSRLLSKLAIHWVCFFFFLVTLYGLWDLNSLTRDQTLALRNGSTKF